MLPWSTWKDLYPLLSHPCCIFLFFFLQTTKKNFPHWFLSANVDNMNSHNMKLELVILTECKIIWPQHCTNGIFINCNLYTILSGYNITILQGKLYVICCMPFNIIKYIEWNHEKFFDISHLLIQNSYHFV